MNIVKAQLKKSKWLRSVFTQPAEDYVPDFRLVEAGLNVNHKTALKFSAVFSAISIRAENIASLPKNVYFHGTKGKESVTDHPVYDLIHYQPNPLMTDFVFWEFIESCVAGWGNAYAVIETDANGYAVALWPQSPDNVEMILSKNALFYKILGGNFKGTYPSGSILHFKSLSLDGLRGIDPVSYHAQSIGLGIAAQDFAADYFKTGGNIKGVLESEGQLGDTEYKKFLEHYQNAAKNFATPLLEYGIKYKAVGVSPEAAQMIQTRIFQIQDVSRIWKVPVSLLAEHTHSTFTNTEQQDIQFVKYALRPEVKRFETECEVKLFTKSERARFSVKFDLKGLLRGDLKTQAMWYHYAIFDGWLNRNEVRDLENLNPVEGLDEYLVPVNMQTPEALEKTLQTINNK